MGFRTPWGLPRSVSSPLLQPWLGSLCRSYAPIDDWLPSYDAKVDLPTFCIMPKIITQRGYTFNMKCDYFG